MTSRTTRARITTFEDFRTAVSAYRLPRILLTALNMDLFTKLGEQRWTMPELAKALQVSNRGLTILCRTLAMAGLLHKKGGVYWNTQLAATALNRAHASYRGDYLDLLQSHWNDWTRLRESVQSGLPLDHDEPEEPDYRRRFTWAMHYRALETAPKIAAQIDLCHAKTLLDLGGGPGTYAMAFLARNPSLYAAVCDRPAALEVAKEIAAAHKAGGRLAYVPLDFTQAAIPGTYDVIWYSNVLHIYPRDINRAIFKRALAALNPGGRFIIQDAFLNDREALFPEEASLFAVSMLLFTEGGDTYSAAETTEWLREAGFGRIRLLRMKKETEDWEDGILEALAPGLHPGRTGRPARSRGSSRCR
jgi:SAM-dependent methyltransferase